MTKIIAPDSIVYDLQAFVFNKLKLMSKHKNRRSARGGTGPCERMGGRLGREALEKKKKPKPRRRRGRCQAA